MLCVVLLLVTSLQLTEAIHFNYNLQKYQIQCFHESTEKDSRYQISIKGETSEYYLHVVETGAVHQDSRATNAQYKQYSAFAGNDTIITFCIGNMADKAIYFDIQFYHGIFLQDSFDVNIQGRELEDLADRWTSLLKMVEGNYEVYRRHLFGRRASSQRISMVLLGIVGLIVLGSALIKWLQYRRVVVFLKEKKAV